MADIDPVDEKLSIRYEDSFATALVTLWEPTMRICFSGLSRSCVIAILGLALTAPGGGTATAAGAFDRFKGSWGGGGTYRLQNGSSEKIRCKAYYNPKSGGTNLGMAIRCASKGSKFELRAKLKNSGGSVSGSWEERTFNAGGGLSGSVSKSAMKLRINGSLQGNVTISSSGKKQFVSISTSGPGLKSLSISLRKR